MSNNFPIENTRYISNKKSRILIKQRHYTETMAIIKLVQVALDRAAYKLSFDTKFEDFVEGLMVVLLLSLKACTNLCIY